VSSNSNTAITGTLYSTPNHPFLIDIYHDLTPDPSGYGEGQFPVGTVPVQTDVNGNASFSLAIPGAFGGDYFSATATDAATGDTSEFSYDILDAGTVGRGPGGFFGPFVWGNNSFSFYVSVVTNQSYTIETASDLTGRPVAWSPLLSFFATTSPVQIVDTNAAGQARFYRIIAP
jgi:hypothetical protein